MNFECLNLNKIVVFDVVCENCPSASFNDCILVWAQPAVSSQGSLQPARSTSPACASLLAHHITFGQSIFWQNNVPSHVFHTPPVKLLHKDTKEGLRDGHTTQFTPPLAPCSLTVSHNTDNTAALAWVFNKRLAQAQKLSLKPLHAQMALWRHAANPAISKP